MKWITWLFVCILVGIGGAAIGSMINSQITGYILCATGGACLGWYYLDA